MKTKYFDQPAWQVKDHDGDLYLSDDFIDELRESYPLVKVIECIRDANEYAESHFESKLNKKGLVTFLRNWMSRNQKWQSDNADKFRG